MSTCKGALNLVFLGVTVVVSVGCGNWAANQAIREVTTLADENRADEAIAVLESLLEADANNTNARGMLCSLQAQRRWDEAVDTCSEVLRALPDEPQTLFNLGLALYFTGQPEEGIARGRRALEVDPNLRTYIQDTLAVPSARYGDDARMREFFRASTNNGVPSPRVRLTVNGDEKRFTNLDCGISLVMSSEWRVFSGAGPLDCAVGEAAADPVLVLVHREQEASIAADFPKFSRDLSRQFLSRRLLSDAAALLGHQILESEKISIDGYDYEMVIKEVVGPLSARPIRVMSTWFWNDTDSFKITWTVPVIEYTEKAAAIKRIVESIGSTSTLQQ